MSDVRSALDAFIARYLRSYPTLRTRHDQEWPSPCTTGEVDSHGEIAWQPTRRIWSGHKGADQASQTESPSAADGGAPYEHDFAPLERALEVAIHQDICSYFSGYWSGSLEATAPFGAVSLLFLWNEQDAVRLIENQIGHVLAQRRARAPHSFAVPSNSVTTIFFACGAPDTDHVYSVENASGRVLLEQPGRKPLREVAANLAVFLDALTPAPPMIDPLTADAGRVDPKRKAD